MPPQTSSEDQIKQAMENAKLWEHIQTRKRHPAATAAIVLAAEVNRLRQKADPQLLIFADQGMVTEVYSDQPVDVMTIESDLRHAAPEHKIRIPRKCFNEPVLRACSNQYVCQDAKHVNTILAAIEEQQTANSTNQTTSAPKP